MSCEKCKSWRRTDDEIQAAGALEGVGLCTRPVMLWDATEWRDTDDESRRVALPEHADKRMFVTDGSDYFAALYTRRDFSCADFEEKT